MRMGGLPISIGFSGVGVKKDYPLTNKTNYHLVSSEINGYGFEIFYNRGRSMYRWETLLDKWGFGRRYRVYKSHKLYMAETGVGRLDYKEFTSRPFVLMWYLGNDYYQLGFDSNELIMTNERKWLPELILL
jgi:hypothetical protein